MLGKLPFLCVITPIFDGALESFKKLVSELKNQTFDEFTHIAISNGASKKSKEFIESLNDSRFSYHQLLFEETVDVYQLLKNLCIRRSYCLKTYQAERYVFLDADLKIIDKDYFLKVFQYHQETGAELILTKVIAGDKIYPVFPFQWGQFDMANFTFSQKLAKDYQYPINLDFRKRCAPDWEFFNILYKDNRNSCLILDFVSAEKDGNSTYKTLSQSWRENIFR